MKKVFRILVLLIGVFLVTGCVSEKAREDIIEKLTKEKIINKKWDAVDQFTDSGWSSGLKSTRGYGYVYKDKEDKHYVILIEGSSKEVDKKTREYKVRKYNVDSINYDAPTTDNCSYECITYSNRQGTYTENIYKYDNQVYEDYKITRTETTFLIFTRYKYKVEKIN